jgi:hypothetical protein
MAWIGVAGVAAVACYRPRRVPCPRARGGLIESGSGTATSETQAAQRLAQHRQQAEPASAADSVDRLTE